MRALNIIKNISAACGLITAVCLADSMNATSKEIIASVFLTGISIVLLVSSVIEKELSHK